MVGVVVTLVLASLFVVLGVVVIVGSIVVLRWGGIKGCFRYSRVGSLRCRRLVCSPIRELSGREGVFIERSEAALGREFVGVVRTRCFISVGGRLSSGLSAVGVITGSPWFGL